MTRPDPIAIIACGGRFALECIEEGRRADRVARVIALDGESLPEVLAIADDVVKWGQIGRLISALEASGARHVLLIGSISQRPDFRTLVGDFETLKWLPRLLTTMAGGDDSVLRKVIGFFEGGGYEVVSVADVAPALLAEAGALTRQKPSAEDRTDIALGFQVLSALAPFDVGQSLVVGDGRVAAVEAAEGTDAMIERIAEVRAARRVAWRDRAGLLVKSAKTGQDLRVDLPVIGPATVDRCVTAGLSGIVLGAGRVAIASKRECLERADQAGLFIFAQSDPVDGKPS
ncbi:MAG: UDP-2,3-diacylglucosamine diphosphatase LpxI [Pseudomonadota bacterium]